MNGACETGGGARQTLELQSRAVQETTGVAGPRRAGRQRAQARAGERSA